MDARVLEEDGTVIEDEVDTGQLLPRLNEDTSECTEEDLVVAGAEAVEIRGLAQLLLLFERNADFVQFGLELRVVRRKGNKSGESAGSIIVASLLDEPSGRLWEEDHSNGKDKPPNELDADRDLPG